MPQQYSAVFCKTNNWKLYIGVYHSFSRLILRDCFRHHFPILARQSWKCISNNNIAWGKTHHLATLVSLVFVYKTKRKSLSIFFIILDWQLPFYLKIRRAWNYPVKMSVHTMSTWVHTLLTPWHNIWNVTVTSWITNIL